MLAGAIALGIKSPEVVRLSALVSAFSSLVSITAARSEVAALLALGDYGATLYLGGDFSRVHEFPRHGLAAVSTIDGKPTAWKPSVDGDVYTLVPHGGRVFVGGDFEAVDGLPVDLLAHSLEGDGYLTYNLNKHVGARFGVRAWDASHVWGSPLNTGSITNVGPYLGGTARF